MGQKFLDAIAPPVSQAGQTAERMDPETARAIGYQGSTMPIVSGEPSVSQGSPVDRWLPLIAGLAGAFSTPMTPTHPLAPIGGALGGFAQARDVQLERQKQQAIAQATAARAMAMQQARFSEQEQLQNQRLAALAERTAGMRQEHMLDRKLRMQLGLRKKPAATATMSAEERQTPKADSALVRRFNAWLNAHPEEKSIGRWTAESWAAEHPDGQRAAGLVQRMYPKARMGGTPSAVTSGDTTADIGTQVFNYSRLPPDEQQFIESAPEGKPIKIEGRWYKRISGPRKELWPTVPPVGG